MDEFIHGFVVSKATNTFVFTRVNFSISFNMLFLLPSLLWSIHHSVVLENTEEREERLSLISHNEHDQKYTEENVRANSVSMHPSSSAEGPKGEDIAK